MLLLYNDRLISFGWNRRHILNQLSLYWWVVRWNTKLLETLIDDKKKWSSLPHPHYIKANPWQWCWLESTSSDFLHNEHVIASWFQLEQDTDSDSCMLKSLHLRIPHCYQMRRWLKQTWLVLWQINSGHGLKLTWESICCAYHTEKSHDMLISGFWLDQSSKTTWN